MGLKRICSFISRRLFEAAIVIGVIVLLPNLPPYTNFSASIRLPPTKPFEGKLALNEKLNDLEIWHKGDILGPEAFADFNGELYTSVVGGDIVKLVGNSIKPVAKTGKPCKALHEERICGRPLGLRFNKIGDLFVADAYYGIMKVNVETGQKEVIVSPDQEIAGRKTKLFNSVALAENGDIYWTDSSEFSLENGVFECLSDPSGRLIHYDAKSKTNRVLMEKIHFANGIMLSDDEEFVLVAETFGNRVFRYYLKGSKRGTHDVFIDGLPGLPDNLKSDGQGGVWIALVKPVDLDHPSPGQIFLPFPLIRKFLARVLGIFELGFETLNKLYPSEFAQKAVYKIGHFSTLTNIFEPSRTMIIHVNKNGDVVENLSSTNKKLKDFSEIHFFNNYLYLASPFNNYIGRIPLSKIGGEHFIPERVKRDVPVIQAKTESVTKPRTTPKPVTQQKTPPPKPQTTTQSPPPQQPPPPPPKQETNAKRPQQNNPSSTKQTAPPKAQTVSNQKQASPENKDFQKKTPPPKQSPPPTQNPPQKQAPSQQQTPPPKQAPSQQTPPPKQAGSQQQKPPPKQAPSQQTPPPKAAGSQQQNPPPKQTPSQQQAPPPKQQAPPPKQAPSQQTPPPKQAPSQQTPPPKQAPTQQTPPPKQAPSQQTPPPKQAPSQQTPPPKQAPSQQTPPPKQASSQQQKPPPKQAPLQQQTPPPKQAPPQQTPPPKQAPLQQQTPPPKQTPSQQTPPPKQAPSQQQTPPPKQAPPPKQPAPQQRMPPSKQTTTTQTPSTKQSVPVKNSPKSR